MAKQLDKDEIALSITVDGTAARRALAELSQDTVRLKERQKDLARQATELKRQLNITKQDTAEYKVLQQVLGDVQNEYQRVTETIESNTQRQSALRSEIGITGLTLRELGAEARRLRAQLSVMMEGTDGYAATEQQLQAVLDRSSQLSSAVAREQRVWEATRRTLELHQMTVKQLGLEERRLQDIISNPATGAEERAEAARQLEIVRDRTEQLTNANRIAADAWEQQRQAIALTEMTVEQLGLEEQRLQALMANPALGTAERARLAQTLQQVKDRQDQLTNSTRIAADAWEEERKTLRLVDMNAEQLRKELAFLKTQQDRLNPTAQAAEFRTLGRSIQQVEDRIQVLGQNLGPLQRLWRNVKQEMSGVVGVTAGLFAGGLLVNQVRSWITGAAQVSDELANVKKATGLTTAEVQSLNAELRNIDTRTSTQALREIAVGLGQAGEAANAANVDAIDKIVVALGDEFGDNATGIANTLSVLRNNLQDLKTGNYADDIMFIGNALNELGANGLATAPVVSDIANRIAGVAGTFRVTSGEIFGTAATFQELGINTERGSTAYIKILQRMAAEPAKFAEVVRQAGMDAEGFTQDLNDNMQRAFVTIARAAQTAGKENTTFAAILKDLDVDGAGVSELLSKIGTNYQLLEEKTTIATAALQDNASILQEWTDKNSTLGAELDKLDKDISRVFTSPTVMNFFAGLVTVARDTIGWLQRNRDAIVTFAQVLTTAAAAWAAFRLGAIVSAAAMRGYAIATALVSRAKAVLTGNTIAAGRAMVAFNTAVKANPLGLIASALTVVIGLWASFGDEVQAATDEQQKINDKLEEGRRILETIKNLQEQGSVVDKLSREQLLDRQKNLQQSLNELNRYQVQVLASEDKATADLRAQLQRRQEELATLRAASQRTEDEQQKAALRNRATTLLGDIDSLNRRIALRARQTGEAISNADAEAKKRQIQQELDTVNARLDIIAKGGTEQIRTLAFIDSEIQRLQEDQKKASDRNSFQQVQQQIEALQREREAIAGTAAKATTDRSREQLDQIAQQYLRFREDLRNSALTADARELAELRTKHARELAEVQEQQRKLIAAKQLAPGDAATDLGALRAQQNQAELDLINAQEERRLAAYREADAKLTEALREGANAHLQARVEGLDAQIAAAQAAGQSTVDLERQRKDALLVLYAQNAEDAIAAEIAKWQEIIRLTRERLQQLRQENAQRTGPLSEEQIAEEQALSDRILQAERTLNQSLEDINRSRRQREAAAERAYTEQLTQEYRRRLEGQVEVMQGFGQAIQGLDQLMQAFHENENERSFADTAAAKVIGLAQIAINAATAISGAVAASTAGDPYTFAARVAVAIGTVLAGIGQAYAMFNKSETGSAAPADTAPLQPELIQMPSGAVGGPITKGRFTPADSGTLEGPSHSEGGLGVFNMQTGRQVAEFEGGESYMLFSKRFTEANRDQLGRLLEASRTGARLRFDTPLAPPNNAMVRRAVAPVPQFAAGGLTTRGVAMVNVAPPGGGTGQDDPAWVDRIERAAAAFHTAVARMPTDIQATLALNPQYDRTLTRWDDLKGDSRIGRS